MAETTEALSSVNATMVEHRMRLENGTKVFQDTRERMNEIDKRTAPKPVSVGKIVGITLTVVIAGAGALWALANNLRDRPTMDQIHEVMDTHKENGHKETRSDIRAIQVTQGQQKAAIDAISAEQQGQGRKLDSILERLPEPRKPRKRKNR